MWGLKACTPTAWLFACLPHNFPWLPSYKAKSAKLCAGSIKKKELSLGWTFTICHTVSHPQFQFHFSKAALHLLECPQLLTYPLFTLRRLPHFFFKGNWSFISLQSSSKFVSQSTVYFLPVWLKWKWGHINHPLCLGSSSNPEGKRSKANLNLPLSQLWPFSSLETVLLNPLVPHTPLHHLLLHHPLFPQQLKGQRAGWALKWSLPVCLLPQAL